MRPTTFVSAGSINRYYDPSTDQFISVDPAVQETDQPYVFTNDDPLNETDPPGKYKYKDVELVGPSKTVGNAAQVMTYIKSHVVSAYPFDVTGGKNIRDGESLALHVAPSFLGGVGTVQVSNVTSTSYTFTVASKGYFDPKGSTITFSTSTSGGSTYLQESANAPGGPFFAPPLASFEWGVMASSLCYALHGCTSPGPARSQ